MDRVAELGHDPGRLARARHPSGDRRARAALHQGRRQVGGVHRRPLEVRPHHGRDGGDRGAAARPRACSTASSSCTSTSARRSRAIRAIKDALQEASRIYVELHALGANMRYVDCGGGLGVDYDGSQTNFHSSVNYTLQEYASDIVSQMAEACNAKGVPHPDIVTESGRALVAHHSVLIFNVLGTNEILLGQIPESLAKDEHRIIQKLYETYAGVTRKNFLETYHDALQLKEEAITAFNLGFLDLKARARVEQLFWATCEKILKIVRDLPYVPDDLEGLEKQLSDTYYCNFSLFQSLPDHWAVRQLFPTMPIDRLNKAPTRRAVLADLTCDSDGKMDEFIDLKDVKHFLELHPLNGEPYYIASFLVGAYQEILGDLHNLFGDTDAVHVRLDGDDYRVDHVVEGDSVTEVLSYVQYSKDDLDGPRAPQRARTPCARSA